MNPTFIHCFYQVSHPCIHKRLGMSSALCRYVDTGNTVCFHVTFKQVSYHIRINSFRVCKAVHQLIQFMDISFLSSPIHTSQDFYRSSAINEEARRGARNYCVLSYCIQASPSRVCKVGRQMSQHRDMDLTNSSIHTSQDQQRSDVSSVKILCTFTYDSNRFLQDQQSSMSIVITHGCGLHGRQKLYQQRHKYIKPAAQDCYLDITHTRYLCMNKFNNIW